MENHVISLALSKKLKELGVPQKSVFKWSNDELVYGEWTVLNGEYSAFLASELGEILPSIWGELLLEKSSHSLIEIYKIKGDDQVIEWEIVYSNAGSTPFTSEQKVDVLHQEFDVSLANVMAKMIIYLLENKLIQL